MVRSGAHLAETQEEKNAVYRFRYDVYVEELGWSRDVADHDRKMLIEAEDETARIFYAAIDGGYYVLVIFGILNAAVAAYYYLRVVMIMYMREPEVELPAAATSPMLWAGIALALLGTILLGVLPGGVLEAAMVSAAALL